MELTINNYKNIEKVVFEIIDNTLILVGKNSVGKSNILEAIENKHYSLNNKYEDTIYISSDLSSLNQDDTNHFNKIFEKIYGFEKCSDEVETKKCLDKINNKLAKDFVFDKEIQNIKLKAAVNDRNIISPEFIIDGVNVGVNIGSGIKRRFAFKLLRKLKMSTDSGKYVIMVDNPELHAHPAMIRVICSELRELSKQGHLVIVSTHAESVLEYLETDISQIAKITKKDGVLVANQVKMKNYLKRVFDFYKEPNIFKLPNGKFNVSLEHIVHHDLESFSETIFRDKTLKILFADIIVIGEGSSEEILFDYLFSECYELFLYKNIDYFTAFGKFYLPFFFILASMYDVKVVCMYDVDNLENKSHKAFHDGFVRYEKMYKDEIVMLGLDPDLETELEVNMPGHRVEKPVHIYNTIKSNPHAITIIRNKIVEAIEKFS